MTLFTASDYAALASIVFQPDYPGFATARGVVEAPNGDGNRDGQKRYSHVAEKYLGDEDKDPGELFDYLCAAYDMANKVASALGVPQAFWPSYNAGCLRVLEYPIGVGGHLHTDFDLFTLNLYRNTPNAGLPAGEVHMGELGELLGLGPAAPHAVHPDTERVQHSIVYFAIPDHAAVLPSGQTVGSWIQDRLARSRYDR